MCLHKKGNRVYNVLSNVFYIISFCFLLLYRGAFWCLRASNNDSKEDSIEFFLQIIPVNTPKYVKEQLNFIILFHNLITSDFIFQD